MHTIGFHLLLLEGPFASELKHVLISFNFVKLHKLQIANQFKVLIVLVWHCGCAANLFVPLCVSMTHVQC